MIVPFHIPIKISIPISKESLVILLFFFALLVSSSSIRIMKVHPMPKKRNNVTISSEMSSRNPNFSPEPGRGRGKKLRRLPHVFSRVLELPFRSDADVSVEESAEFFRFVAGAEIGSDFRAHTVEIHPGVTKIVVREGAGADAGSGSGGGLELALDELELDMWRFRLPDTTRPELASAVFVDGELIVTVPKGGEEDSDGGEVWGDGNGGSGGFSGGMGGRLVLVQ